jgi:aspartate 1-decarboxylase
MRVMLHSRVEGFVEDINPNCKGSITIPRNIMIKEDILEHEQVHVLNKDNGERFITYAIAGDEFCLNGAATWKGNIGDKLIILSYELI